MALFWYRMVRNKFFDNNWVDSYVRKKAVSNKNTSGKRVLAEEISNTKTLKQKHIDMQIRWYSWGKRLVGWGVVNDDAEKQLWDQHQECESCSFWRRNPWKVLWGKEIWTDLNCKRITLAALWSILYDEI